MTTTRVRLDIDIETAAAKVVAASGKGMGLAVEHLLTEANKRVPHDEGTLERSGTTSTTATSSSVEGAVSYDTPYATAQHEDMSLHHDGKGEAKWLENTMATEAERLGMIVATVIRGVT